MSSGDLRNFSNLWSDSEATDDEVIPTKNSKNYERSCKYCGKLVKNVKALPKHEKKCLAALENTADIVTCKDGSKRFLCDICFRLFKYLTGLSKHRKWHNPPGGYVCKYCDARYCTSQELDKHKQDSHQVYKCQICKNIYETLETYLDHIKVKHNGVDRVLVNCNDCGQNFKSQMMLNYHKSTKCGTIKPFSCDQCGKKNHYQTQATLNIHKLIHKGEKSFCCSYCGKSFLSKGQLTVHERMHTGEKPYKCEVCPKAFAYRESLVTHSSLHTGIKPYACEACNARFSCVGNLQKHRRTRPNSCGLPQYCVNKKIAPRASSRIPGTLTMSNVKITRANKVIAQKGKLKKKQDECEHESNNDISLEERNEEQIVSVIEENLQIISKQNIDDDYDDIKKDEEQIVSVIEENLQIISKQNIDDDYDDIKKDEDEVVILSEEDHQNGLNNALQMLEIQVLQESLQEETQEVIEPPVSCFVVNTGEKIQVIQVDTVDNNCESNKIVKLKSYENINSEVAAATATTTTVTTLTAPSEGFELEENKIIELEDIGVETNEFDNVITETDMYIVVVKEDDSNQENFAIPMIVENTDTKCIEDKNLNIDTEKSDSLSEIENNSEIDDPVSTGGSDLNYSDEDDREKSVADDEENNEMNKTSLILDIPYKDSYECHLCPKIYQHRKSFLKHLKGEHNLHQPELTEVSNKRIKRKQPAKYVCTVCKKTYSKTKSFQKHLKNHGPEGKLIYKSSCCSQYFETEIEATNHDISNHNEILSCPICKKIFPNPDNLGAHKRYAHKITEQNKDEEMKKKICVCQKCGKKFTSKTALSDHERSDCGKSPLYKCDECDKNFHSAGSLKTHKTVHTGELPHLCTFCGKSFRTFGQVKIHQRKHNGEKPFKCSLCPKAFAYRESLLTHVSVHTGVKRFMCESCGRRFSCISNLVMHRKHNKATCGAVPINTKPIAETMGVARGVLYVGEKPEQ